MGDWDKQRELLWKAWTLKAAEHIDIEDLGHQGAIAGERVARMLEKIEEEKPMLTVFSYNAKPLMLWHLDDDLVDKFNLTRKTNEIADIKAKIQEGFMEIYDILYSREE